MKVDDDCTDNEKSHEIDVAAHADDDFENETDEDTTEANTNGSNEQQENNHDADIIFFSQPCATRRRINRTHVKRFGLIAKCTHTSTMRLI